MAAAKDPAPSPVGVAPRGAGSTAGCSALIPCRGAGGTSQCNVFNGLFKPGTSEGACPWDGAAIAALSALYGMQQCTDHPVRRRAQLPKRKPSGAGKRSPGALGIFGRQIGLMSNARTLGSNWGFVPLSCLFTRENAAPSTNDCDEPGSASTAPRSCGGVGGLRARSAACTWSCTAGNKDARAAEREARAALLMTRDDVRPQPRLCLNCIEGRRWRVSAMLLHRDVDVYRGGVDIEKILSQLWSERVTERRSCGRHLPLDELEGLVWGVSSAAPPVPKALTDCAQSSN